MVSLLRPLTRHLPAAFLGRRSATACHDKVLSEAAIADLVAGIRHAHDLIGASTPAQLREHTHSLRRFLAGGSALTDRQVLSLGGAITIESIQQTLGLQLYDCQLVAGLILCHGAIAQMHTGEGKTLAGLMPAVMLSLSGHGVHVATPNEYLAHRDWNLLRPALEALGLHSDLLTDRCDTAARIAAYRADITYGPAHVFGFDFLRDQIARQQLMQQPLGQPLRQRLRGESPACEVMQRRLHVAIVDEIDHVLIDDAINPMIISDASGQAAADAQLHQQAAEVAKCLQIQRDFDLQADGRNLWLTPAGIDTIYQEHAADDQQALQRAWHEYVQLALQASHLFQRDVHYVVVDDHVRVVDTSTGRVYKDRQWNESQHQAIEAKEGVTITATNQALAQITRQDFYRRYDFVCGMTGTAAECRDEFQSVYGLGVVEVPLRQMSRRELWPVKIAHCELQKLAGIVDETLDCIARRRAVLIGTPSVAQSRAIAKVFAERELDFVLLNGTQDISEAEAIAGAGRTQAVTIATNLAGRGTDIRLDADVAQAGGLHVIVSEPNENGRVDRQLIGRAARGGDPGSARVFACPEDSLFVKHAPWIGRWMLRADPGNAYDSQHLAQLIARTQRSLARKATHQRRKMLSQAKGSNR